MTTVIPSILTNSQAISANSTQSQRTQLLALAGQIGLKIFLVGSGLAVGGFLGLLIAIFSGLVDFTC